MKKAIAYPIQKNPDAMANVDSWKKKQVPSAPSKRAKGVDAPHNSKIERPPSRFRSLGCIFIGGAAAKHSDAEEHQVKTSGQSSNLSKHSIQALHAADCNPSAKTLSSQAPRKPRKFASRKGVETPSICSSTDVDDDMSLGSNMQRIHHFVVSTPKQMRSLHPSKGAMKVRTLNESLNASYSSKTNDEHKRKAKVSFDSVFVHYHSYQQLHHIPYGTTHGPPFLALGTRFRSTKIKTVPNHLSQLKSRKKSSHKGRPQPLTALQRYNLLMKSGVQPRGSTNSLATRVQHHPSVPEPPKHRPQTPKKQLSPASSPESKASNTKTTASSKRRTNVARPAPQSVEEVLSSPKTEKWSSISELQAIKPRSPHSRLPIPQTDDSEPGQIASQPNQKPPVVPNSNRNTGVQGHRSRTKQKGETKGRPTPKSTSKNYDASQRTAKKSGSTKRKSHQTKSRALSPKARQIAPGNPNYLIQI